MMTKFILKRAVVVQLRYSSSSPPIVEWPLHNFLRDLKSELAQAQKDSEKRLIDTMNTNNFKVAGLTIGGAAAFGTFLLFILQNAGFQVLNPYLPLERKP